MGADRELLAHLAIVIGHDVPGIGIDPDQPGQLNGYASLLGDLAHRGVGDRLAQFHRAARQRPQVVVHLVDQQ
jgi:hypothetical protein